MTLTVTPDAGYAVTEVSGKWYATWASANARSESPVALDGIELTPVEGADNQWTFVMQAAHAEFSVSYEEKPELPTGIDSVESGKSKVDNLYDLQGRQVTSPKKKGVYVMGVGPMPTTKDVKRCLRLVELTSVLFILTVCLILYMLLGIHIQLFFEGLIPFDLL